MTDLPAEVTLPADLAAGVHRASEVVEEAKTRAAAGVSGVRVRSNTKPRHRSASYLSPPDFHRLDWACMPVRAAFKPYGVYLVGSVTERPDFRDIDLRIIVPDDEYEAMFPTHARKLLLDIAVSGLIAKAAALPWPIDAQFQSFSECNNDENRDKERNPMGGRMSSYAQLPEVTA